MNIIGYEILNLANSCNADEGIIILLPLLISDFPKNAGENALYDLRKMLLTAA